MLLTSEKHNAARTDLAYQRCISPNCGATYEAESVRTSCDRCGDLLDIAYDWGRAGVPKHLSEFETFWSQRTNPIRFSGVWRFHELLPFAPQRGWSRWAKARHCCSRPMRSDNTWV